MGVKLCVYNVYVCLLVSILDAYGCLSRSRLCHALALRGLVLVSP